MALTVGELVAYLRVDQDKFTRGLAAARAQMASAASDIRKHLDSIADNERFKKFAASMDQAAVSVLKLMNNLSNIPTVIALLAQLAAVGQSAAGALLVLPGVLAAVALAVTAAKVGMSGFGDALKSMGDAQQFAEALKKLSPAARAAAIAIKQQAPAWREVKRAAQEALFSGTAPMLTKIGKVYAPVARDGLAGINKEFNTGIKSALGFASSAGAVKDVGAVFSNTRTSVADLVGGGLKPLLQILLDVVKVGSDFLPNLTGGFGNAAQAAADFVRKARESGKLREWISGGLSTLGDLWQLLSNIGSIVKTVFGAFKSEGAGLLPMLLNLTNKVKEFLASAQGQQVLRTLADALKRIGDIVTTVVMTALRELTPAITKAAPGFAELAKQIGDVLVTAITTVGPLLISLAGWLADNMNWLGPVAGAVYGLTLAIRAWSAASAVLSAIHAGAAAKIIGDYAAMAARGTVAAATMIATWVKVAAGAIASAATTSASWVAAGARVVWTWAGIAASAIASAATTAISATASAAVVVAKWAWMSAQALFYAGRMALAWFIGLGPIGWAIAAIAAVVALVIVYWDDIVAATEAAWSWVQEYIITPVRDAAQWTQARINELKTWIAGCWDDLVQDARDKWNWIKENIVNPISEAAEWVGDRIDDVMSFFDLLAALPGRALEWFGGICRSAREKFEELKRLVGAIPGQILDALGDLGRLLYRQGEKILQGLWDGLKSLWGKVTGWISDIAGWIAANKGPISYDAKLLIPHGQAIMRGLLGGMQSQEDKVLGWLRDFTGELALDPAASGGLPFTPPGLPPAGADAAGSQIVGDPAGRAQALVSIGVFNASPDQSPDSIARDLAWLSKAKG